MLEGLFIVGIVIIFTVWISDKIQTHFGSDISHQA